VAPNWEELQPPERLELEYMFFSVNQMNNLLRQKAEEEEGNQMLKNKIQNEELAAILQKAIWGYERPQTK